MDESELDPATFGSVVFFINIVTSTVSLVPLLSVTIRHYKTKRYLSVVSIFIGMGTLTTNILTCDRCGHIWCARHKDDKPKTCPKCRSPYWDTPRRKSKSKSK